MQFFNDLADYKWRQLEYEWYLLSKYWYVWLVIFLVLALVWSRKRSK